MRCKKEIMGIAALLVLFFHFYIPFGTSHLELFARWTAYIGVDMFFFLSANSLAGRSDKGRFKYGQFLLNRISYIYIPFVVITILTAIYNEKDKWNFERVIKVITGSEFVDKGGGAFLWYFIGIMMIYLMVPLFLIIKRRLKLFGFPVLLAVWVAIALIIKNFPEYSTLYILVNRLPVFFVGLYYDEVLHRFVSRGKWWIVLVTDVVALAVSLQILFVWGGAKFVPGRMIYTLKEPFADMYYVAAVPFVLALVMLVDSLVTWINGRYKSIVLKFIGGITLELYGLQMAFGYVIENKLVSRMPKTRMQAAFFLTVIILVVMAYILNQAFRLARKYIPIAVLHFFQD